MLKKKYRVNANSLANKMNISNLAMIFTPVIFHDFNQVDEHYTSDWSPDDLFEDLIFHYQLLFPRAEDYARRNNDMKLQKALIGENPFSQYSQSNLLYIINSVTPPSPQTSNNMLLTQPMHPPAIPANSSGANSPGGPLDYQYNTANYPPKLTTIIGVAPPASTMTQNQQRPVLLQQHPQQANYGGNARSGPHLPAINTDPNTRIVPQRYQSEALLFHQQDPKASQSAAPGTFIKTPEHFVMSRSISEKAITQRGSSMANNTPTTETAPYVAFSGPNSNEPSRNNSPLPSREGVTTIATAATASTGPIDATLKRHSGTPQPAHASAVAPPRHDSLRKLNARFQADGEKLQMTEESGDESPARMGGQSSPLPPLPTNTSTSQQSPLSITTTDTNDTSQKHIYYQPNTIHDFNNLHTVIEGEDLDPVNDDDPTTIQPSLSESTKK